MGMKDYKFLLRSRDLIVSSEKKIRRIDKKMTEIEQKVKNLKSEKTKLRSRKSVDWQNEISNRIQDKKKELEIEKGSQEMELEDLDKRDKAMETKSYVAFWFAVIYLIAPGVIAEDIIVESELWLSLFAMSNCGIWIFMLIYFGDYNSDALRKEIIDKYQLSDKESVIDNLVKEESDFSKQLKKKGDIENKLVDHKVQLKHLINEKKELAEVIKAAWKDVNHLVPKT